MTSLHLARFAASSTLAAVCFVAAAGTARAQDATLPMAGATPSSPATTAPMGAVPVAPVVPAAPAVPATDTAATPSGAGMTFGTGEATAPVGEVTGYQTLRPNRQLLASGAVFLLGSYATSAIVAGVNDNSADRKLFIPVVGPWMDLADRQCNGRECKNEDWSKVALVGSGVLQGVGALLALSSLFVPEKVNETKIAAGPFNIQMSPSQIGSRGYGMAALGTF